MPQVTRVTITQPNMQAGRLKDWEAWFDKVTVLFVGQIPPPLKGMRYDGLIDIDEWLQDNKVSSERQRKQTWKGDGDES